MSMIRSPALAGVLRLRKAHQKSWEVSKTSRKDTRVGISLLEDKMGFYAHCQANVDEKITAASRDECCRCWRENDSGLSNILDVNLPLMTRTTMLLTYKNENDV